MRRNERYLFAFCLGLALLVGAAGPAAAVLISFDGAGLDHGLIIDDEFLAQDLRISADNVQGPDVAVLFDTELRNLGLSFEDLEFPVGQQGNILILQANTTGCDDGICDEPDDIGARPAGHFVLDFLIPITSFGLDLLDVEGPEEMGSLSFFSKTAVRGSFVQVGPEIPFEDLADPGSSFFRNAVFGDNSANAIAPITAAELGVGQFDRVVVSMGGSGGIDNLDYTPVPEPGTFSLVGLGLAGLVAAGRRRRLRAQS